MRMVGSVVLVVALASGCTHHRKLSDFIDAERASVTVETTDDAVVSATIVRSDGVSVLEEVDGGDTIDLSQVARVREKRRGEGALTGGFIGLVIGLAMGAGGGFAASSFASSLAESDCRYDCAGGPAMAVPALVLATLGAIVGGSVGAGVGANYIYEAPH